MKCCAFSLHSFEEFFCLTTFNCVASTRLTQTTEFKKEVSPEEESNTKRTCSNHAEKLDGITLSTHVRATHLKMLPQHSAADSIGEGTGQPLGERGKVRNAELGGEKNNDLSAGKKLHNLLYEIISDIG